MIKNFEKIWAMLAKFSDGRKCFELLNNHLVPSELGMCFQSKQKLIWLKGISYTIYMIAYNLEIITYGL